MYILALNICISISIYIYGPTFCSSIREVVKGDHLYHTRIKNKYMPNKLEKKNNIHNIKDNGRFLLKIQIVFMLVVVQNRVCFFNCVTRIEETKLVYAFSRKFVSVCKTYYGGHKGVLKWS